MDFTNNLGCKNYLEIKTCLDSQKGRGGKKASKLLRRQARTLGHNVNSNGGSQTKDKQCLLAVVQNIKEHSIWQTICKANMYTVAENNSAVYFRLDFESLILVFIQIHQ